MSNRLPYKRNSSSDFVWTPAEIQRITNLSTEYAHVQEYASQSPLNEDDEQRSQVTGSISKKTSTMTVQQQKQSIKKTSTTTTYSTHTLHKNRQRKKYSGGGDNPSILMDWYNTAAWQYMAGFNLELWWSRSAGQQRANAGIILLLAMFFVLHFCFAMWLFWISWKEEIRSPYTCETPECIKAAKWMGEFLDESEPPCDNFYKYICGNHHHEEEFEGQYFDYVLSFPSFTIEFGEDSILASILKDFRHDPKADQSIEYYRRCLNFPIRQQFGLEALMDQYENVFGTRDLTKFETGMLSVEEVASRMFKAVGHASFFNMAFYVYPFIQILRPSAFVSNLHFKANTLQGLPQENQKFVELLFNGLLPLLGVPKNSTLMKDMVQGVNMMTNIIYLIDEHLSGIAMPKLPHNSGNPEYDKYYEQLRKVLFDTGYCPPNNVALDMEKVLSLWLQEPDWRIEFYDLMSLKYFHSLQLCFGLDRNSYVPIDPSPKEPWTYTFTYPKTAFVALWVLELFWGYRKETDTVNILNAWGINEANLPWNSHVEDAHNDAKTSAEYQCLSGLWFNLGYMPSTRYLLATKSDPVEHIKTVEVQLEQLFVKISDIFDRIPDTEISFMWKYMAMHSFRREVYIDFVMPLPSGLLDNSAIDDFLHFTQDHLRNTIIAVHYTVERARQNWLGATNVHPTAKFWGEGEPYDIRSQLLDLKSPMVISAPFKEEYRAAEKQRWETFLGTSHTHYLLFPISMANEPHITDTLALQYAGSVIKQIRSFLKLLSNPFSANFPKPRLYLYPSITNWSNLLYFDDRNPFTDNQADRVCSVLYSRFPQPYNDDDFLYKYGSTDAFNTFLYNWFGFQQFFNLVAVKEAFRLFRDHRRHIHQLPFNWTLSLEQREFRMQRILPGKKMSKFTEDQLFFMTYVRHTCRGNWRTHNDHTQPDRYFLETAVLSVLMQAEEFAQTWKCDKNSFMNNKGKDRCMRWMP